MEALSYYLKGSLKVYCIKANFNEFMYRRDSIVMFFKCDSKTHEQFFFYLTVSDPVCSSQARLSHDYDNILYNLQISSINIVNSKMTHALKAKPLHRFILIL